MSLVGKKAPAFTLPDQTGTRHKLADYAGQWVVLYWYPKDSTPGCTKQACGFRDANAEFAKLNTAVLGASILDAKSKAKFAEKQGLNFALLADEEHAVAEKYGVWAEKSLYGRKFMGINRETFLIGPDGKVKHHWPKAVGNEAHAQEVLKVLKELQAQG